MLILTSPANITDFEKFRTSAGLVLEVIKHQDSEPPCVYTRREPDITYILIFDSSSVSQDYIAATISDTAFAIASDFTSASSREVPTTP